MALLHLFPTVISILATIALSFSVLYDWFYFKIVAPELFQTMTLADHISSGLEQIPTIFVISAGTILGFVLYDLMTMRRQRNPQRFLWIARLDRLFPGGFIVTWMYIIFALLIVGLIRWINKLAVGTDLAVAGTLGYGTPTGFLILLVYALALCLMIGFFSKKRIDYMMIKRLMMIPLCAAYFFITSAFFAGLDVHKDLELPRPRYNISIVHGHDEPEVSVLKSLGNGLLVYSHLRGSVLYYGWREVAHIEVVSSSALSSISRD